MSEGFCVCGDGGWNNKELNKKEKEEEKEEKKKDERKGGR